MKIPKGLTDLIDGDMITYNAACAAEKRSYRIYMEGHEDQGYVHQVDYKKEADKWIEENQTKKRKYFADLEIDIGPKSHALSNAKQLINKCLRHCKTEEYIVYLSPEEGNFRENLALSVPYKGNRWSPEKRDEEREKGNWTEWLDATEGSYIYQEKPFHYEAVRKYLLDHHGAIMCRRQEADDSLGIKQMESFNGKVNKKNAKTIICTLDKDLRTIPGYHYNWSHEEFAWVSPKDALFNFYCQILTGDKSDNIVGLPYVPMPIREKYELRKTNGCGPVSATAILEGCKTEKQYNERILECFVAYVEEDRAAEGLSKEEINNIAIALINEAGGLVRIRQEPLEVWKFPI